MPVTIVSALRQPDFCHALNQKALLNFFKLFFRVLVLDEAKAIKCYPISGYLYDK